VAGPCALFAIGASLGGNTIARGVARPLSVLAALKLIAHPVLAAAAFFWVFPVAPYPASIGVLAATLPSASNGFIVAQRYSLDVRSISAAIVVGTLVSLLTVSFAIWALKLH
jgi:predicted permease